MAGSAGSFAGGFINAFLAAKRLKMEQSHWQVMDDYYRHIMSQRNGAQDAYNSGKSGYYNGQGGSGSGSSGGAKGALSPSDRDLAIRTIYGEAGSQSEQGQAAVAHVIRNRTQDSAFGGGTGSAHDVIMEPKQFSLWNKGDPAGDTARSLDANSSAYQKIGSIVDGVWGGKIPDPTNGAVNYYNPSVASPAWGDKLAQSNDVTIGAHRFVGKGNFDLKAPEPEQQGGAPPAGSSATPGQPTANNYLTPDQVHSTLAQYHGGSDNIAVDPATGHAYHWDTGLPAEPAGPNNGNTTPPPAAPPAGTSAALDSGVLPTQTASNDTASNDDDTSGGSGGGSEEEPEAAAKGGPVQRFADGGDVEDDSQDDTSDSNSPLPVSNAAYSDGSGSGSVLPVQDGTLHDSQDYVPGENVQDTAYGPGYAMNRMETSARRAGAPRIGAGAPRMGASGGMRMGMGRMPSAGRSDGGIDPNQVQNPAMSDPTAPEITDGQGGLSDGAANAIQDGMHMLGQMFGLNGNGAIPGDANAAAGRHAFLNGEGAMSSQEVAQVKRSVDPNGRLDDSMANIAGLEALHKYYLAQGNTQAAGQTAASMLMYSREAAAQFGAEAYNLIHKGDVQGAVKKLERGYDEVPDGMTVTGDVQADGSVAVMRKDMQGNVVDQHTVSPHEIMGAALGLKNGTAYWNLLNEAVQGKQAKQNGKQFSDEDHKAFAEITGGGHAQGVASGAPQSAPQSAPSATPPAAAPTSPPTTPAAATPNSNAPQGGVLPPTPQPASAAAPAPSPDATPQPAAATAPQPASPQPAGVLPDTHAKGLDDYATLSAQTYARLGVELHPPAQFVATPSNFDNMSPQGQTALRNWQKQQLSAWQKEMGERKSLADKFVQDTLLNERQRNNQQFLNDRDANNNTARMTTQEQLQTQRMTQQEKLEAEREKASADRIDQGKEADWNRQQSTPLKMDDPALAGADSDPYTHAGRILPNAVSDYGTNRFDAGTKQLLTGAVVNVARYSQTSPDIAARAVNSIVTPSDPDNDKTNFNATRDKQTGLMTVAFSDGLAVKMPSQDFVMLTNIRTAQQAYMRSQRSTAATTAARQDQEATLQGKIAKKDGNDMLAVWGNGATPPVPQGEDDLVHQSRRGTAPVIPPGPDDQGQVTRGVPSYPVNNSNRYSDARIQRTIQANSPPAQPSAPSPSDDPRRLDTTMRALDVANQQGSDVGREQDRWNGAANPPRGVLPEDDNSVAQRQFGDVINQAQRYDRAEDARRQDTTQRALDVANQQGSDVSKEQDRWGQSSPNPAPPRQRKGGTDDTRAQDTTIRALDVAGQQGSDVYKEQQRWRKPSSDAKAAPAPKGRKPASNDAKRLDTTIRALDTANQQPRWPR